MDKIYLFSYILDMDIIADSSESYSSPWGKIFQDIFHVSSYQYIIRCFLVKILGTFLLEILTLDLTKPSPSTNKHFLIRTFKNNLTKILPKFQ